MGRRMAVKETVALCDHCGEEVMFDAYVYANGEIANVFENAYCPGCETDIKYSYTTMEQEIAE
jgi:formylmethanofuran dehydrogenase subunit E